MRPIDKAEWAHELVDETYNRFGSHVKVGESDKDCDMIILKRLASTDKVMELIERIGGDKEQSIVETIRQSHNPDSKAFGNHGSRKRITDNQRFAIAAFLYERFSGSEDITGEVISQAWGE